MPHFVQRKGKCSGYHPVSKSRFRGHSTFVLSTIDNIHMLLLNNGFILVECRYQI